MHQQARAEFFEKVKNNDPKTDPLKLKAIAEMAKSVPQDVKYREPNFVRISNGLKKCQDILQNLIALQDFKACDQVKQLQE